MLMTWLSVEYWPKLLWWLQAWCVDSNWKHWHVKYVLLQR